MEFCRFISKDDMCMSPDRPCTYMKCPFASPTFTSPAWRESASFLCKLHKEDIDIERVANRFAELIADKCKMRSDKYQDSWKTDDIKTLVDHLGDEIDEFRAESLTMNLKGMTYEAIDIAACAMLVWYAAHRDMNKGEFKCG